VEEAALILECAEDGQKLQDDILTERIRFCYRWRKKLHNVFRFAAWSVLLLHIFEYPIWTFRRSDDSWKDGEVYPSYQLPYIPVLASTFVGIVLVVVLSFAVILELGYHGKSRHRRMTQTFAIILAIYSCSLIMQLIYCIVGTGVLFSTFPIATFFIILLERKYDRHVGYILRLLPRFIFLLALVVITVVIFTVTAFLIIPSNSMEIKEFFPTFGQGLWNMLMVLNGSNWPIPMMPAFNENRAYAFFFYIYIIIGDWIVLNIVLGFVYLFFRLEQRTIVQREQELKDHLYSRAFGLLDERGLGYLEYSQVESLIMEVYSEYDYTLRLPDSSERHELLLQLDEEGKGVIDSKTFHHIHTRCFGSALRVMRSKFTKIQRFVLVARENPSLSLSYRLPPNRSRSSSSLSQRISMPAFPLRPPPLRQSNQFENECISPGDDTEESRNRSLSSAASAYGRLDSRVVDHMLQVRGSFTNNLNHDPDFRRKRDISISEQQQMVENMPSSKWYNWISKVAMFVDSFHFDILSDSVIDVLGVLCLSKVDCHAPASHVLFVLACGIEMCCKLLAKGFFRYYKSYRNSLDGVLTIVIVLLMATSHSSKSSDANLFGFCNNFVLQSMILVRVVLWPRNILASQRFAQFRNTHRLAFSFAFQTASHFSFLLLCMFAILYVFAALGQQLFGGAIVKTGEKGIAISQSEYGTSEYWPLNFNDMPSGLVTMFVLLHVNNMHVTTSGFVASQSQWAEVFFACFYAVGVLFMLNIVTAVVINQFVGYLQSVSKAKDDSELHRETRSDENSVAAKKSLEEEQTVDNPMPISQPNISLEPTFSKSVFSSTQKRRFLSLLIAANTPTVESQEQVANETTPTISFSSPQAPSTINNKDRQPRTPLLHSRQNIIESASVNRYGSMDNSVESSTIGPMSCNATVNPIILTPEPHRISDHKSNFAEAITPVKSNAKTSNMQSQQKFAGGNVSSFHALRLSESAQKLRNSTTSVVEDMVGDSADDDDDDDDDDDIYDEEMIADEANVEESDGMDPIVIGLAMQPGSISPQPPGALLSTIKSPSASPYLEDEEGGGSDDDKDCNEYEQSGWFRWMFGTSHIARLQRAAVLVQFAREGSQKVMCSSASALFCFRWRSRGATVFRVAAVCFACIRFFARPQWSLRAEYSCAANDGMCWSDTAVFPRSGLPVMSSQAEAALKIPLLFLLLTGFLLEVGHKESLNAEWWTVSHLLSLSFSRKCRLLLLIYVVGMILTLIISVGVLSTSANVQAQRAIAASSVGAMFYVLWFNRRSLTKLKVVVRVLPRLSVMLLVLLLLVLVFAGFGPLIFHMHDNASSADDDTYFNSFANASWSVFVAITSSSYPSQIMPSYRKFREVAIYFIAFILLGSFLLLNLIMVVVLVEFQRNAQFAADTLRANRRILLMRAFALLAQPVANPSSASPASSPPVVNTADAVDSAAVSSSKLLIVPRRRVLKLLDILRDEYGDFARAGIPKGEAQQVLVEMLDVDGDGRISLADFLYLLDVVRIKLDIIEHVSAAIGDQEASDSNPIALRTVIQRTFVMMANSRVLDIVQDVVCAVLILTSWSLNYRDLYQSSRSSRLIYLLVSLFCIAHTLLKICGLGFKDALRNFRGKFDLVLAGLFALALVGDCSTAISTAHTFGDDVTGWTLLARCLMVLKLVLTPRNLRSLFLLLSNHNLHRLARLHPSNAPSDAAATASSAADGYRERRVDSQLRRNLQRFKRYRRMIAAIGRLLRRVMSKTLTLGIVFLCAGYTFASIGEYSFGGAIRYDLASVNADFAESTYAESTLFTLNFNDFGSAALTLFCCLKVSDFDVITSGFATAVNDYGSRVYFATWYVFGVLLLLNVVKSYFLGEFVDLFGGNSAPSNSTEPKQSPSSGLTSAAAAAAAAGQHPDGAQGIDITRMSSVDSSRDGRAASHGVSGDVSHSSLTRSLHRSLSRRTGLLSLRMVNVSATVNVTQPQRVNRHAEEDKEGEEIRPGGDESFSIAFSPVHGHLTLPAPSPSPLPISLLSSSSSPLSVEQSTRNSLFHWHSSAHDASPVDHTSDPTSIGAGSDVLHASHAPVDAGHTSTTPPTARTAAGEHVPTERSVEFRAQLAVGASRALTEEETQLLRLRMQMVARSAQHACPSDELNNNS
jgi:Na+-transporting methylmalonyl-CoA/oxaloacetate decarboxylase gamma subunit